MFRLNEMQTLRVAGGYMVYVTDEWKHTEAQVKGIVDSVIFGGLGGYLGFVLSGNTIENQLLGGLCWGALGGLAGYYGGYYLSVLENSDLESNNWYNFIPTYY